MQKVKNGIHKMIEKTGAVTETVKRNLPPVTKASVIFTGIYSAGVAILILCSLLKLPIDFIWNSMACEVLFEITFVVSMAALVLTGGIIEAFRFVLKSISFATITDCLFDHTWSGFGSFFFCLAIAGIFFILPVIFAVGVVILFPIVPVLVYRHKGLFSEEELDETDI